MPPAAQPLSAEAPLISVVILNYNGAKWIERCLDSLRKQTIFSQIEVIVADNLSTDGSDALAEKIIRDWPCARFLQNGENLGFCEGNNRGAKLAVGKYLFFLNNDTWLEPACLEILFRDAEKFHAGAATPLVLNYEDDTFQALGAAGFDIFGLPAARFFHDDDREVLMAEGCSYLIQRDLFHELGEFDAALFMFADEYDLSWRVWISGRKVMALPAARLHHRGMAHVNPQGEGAVVEFRTSDTKRFYATRNNLLVLIKNLQFLWCLIVPLQLALLAAEALVSLLLVRRWSFVRRAYLAAIADCWRLRGHILRERRRIRQFRRRSDWQMLRFLSWRFNRWYEVKRLLRFGLPKVTPK
jgi:GT2 family glycosyltransferase